GAHHLQRAARALDRPAVGAFRGEAPVVVDDRQGVAGPYDLRDLGANGGPCREHSRQHVADRGMPGGHAAVRFDERAVRLVERQQRLQVSRVDVLGEQAIAVLRGARGHGYSPRSVGSSMSRSQSPVRLTASDVTIRTRPGKVEIHQAESRYSRPSWTITPHEGVGGWMPRPRNESVASRMIARASSSVATTTSDDSRLGTMWRRITRAAEPPRAWMASTNSRERSTITCERSTRA